MTAGPAALAQLRHELLTPLNHIIGYSELLLEEAGESGRKELEPGLHQVHDEARQLLGLINKFLAPAGGETAAVDLASVREESGCARTAFETIVEQLDLLFIHNPTFDCLVYCRRRA